MIWNRSCEEGCIELFYFSSCSEDLGETNQNLRNFSREAKYFLCSSRGY